MARRSQRTIELRVSELLHDGGIKQPPVDVRSIARLLRAVVETVSAHTDISGMLYRKSDGAVIGINEEHHPNRQRFSIAHELGHLCLHENELYLDRGGPSVFWRDAVSGQGVDDDEIEANHFAASLLMPREFLISDIRQGQVPAEALSRGDERAIEVLARRYRVSPQAMTLRLINLRLIDPKGE
jgi:Zn-dependent peptidase ImmA (M78 family)